MPVGVSSISRDSLGRLASWVENGFAMVVQRDSAGRALTLTASPWRGAGPSLLCTFQYDSNGRIVGMTGDRIDTYLRSELMTPSVRFDSTSGVFLDQTGATVPVDRFVHPPIVDVTRSSINAAADATEQTLGTLAVAGGVLRIGSVVEVWALWENTGGASTKNLNLRLNGTLMWTASSTANQSYGTRFSLVVHDANTIISLNNGGMWTGGAGGALSQKTITDIPNNGLSITINGYWGAAANAEFIRLKHAKLKVMG